MGENVACSARQCQPRMGEGEEKRRRSQFPLGKLLLLLVLLISQQIRSMPDILAAVFRPRTDLCTAADPKKENQSPNKKGKGKKCMQNI